MKKPFEGRIAIFLPICAIVSCLPSAKCRVCQWCLACQDCQLCLACQMPIAVRRVSQENAVEVTASHPHQEEIERINLCAVCTYDLEAVAALGLLADDVQHRVDELGTLCLLQNACGSPTLAIFLRFEKECSRETMNVKATKRLLSSLLKLLTENKNYTAGSNVRQNENHHLQSAVVELLFSSVRPTTWRAQQSLIAACIQQ